MSDALRDAINAMADHADVLDREHRAIIYRDRAEAISALVTLERQRDAYQASAASLELAISNHADRLQTVVDEAWGPIEVLDLEQLISEVERRAYVDRREFVAMRENASRIDAERKKALERIVELGAELARVTGERDEVWRTLCGIDLAKPPTDMVSEFLQDPKQRSLFLAAWAEDARALVAEHTETSAALTRAREALGRAGKLAKDWEARGTEPVRFGYHEQYAADFAEGETYARCAEDLRAALADATGATNTEGGR